MIASIADCDATSITLHVTIPLKPSMLEKKGEVQAQLSKAGYLGRAKTLEQFDPNGEPIEKDNVVYHTRHAPQSFVQDLTDVVSTTALTQNNHRTTTFLSCQN